MFVLFSLIFSYIRNIFVENQIAIFNMSILLFTFLESYVCPLAIIKLMVIISNWSMLKRFKRPQYTYKHTYILQLKTFSISDNVCRISFVSIVMEGQGNIQYYQLSYCGQDCQKIPPALWNMYGAKVNYLDLSYNSIETLKGLEKFTRLEELILDNNKLADTVNFPFLPFLKTLSLNNNEITNLEDLVNKLCDAFPELTYLSLLSNKACPNQLSDLEKDESDYQRYRYFVIYKLKNLRFLDSRRVTDRERMEASARGEFMRVRRPTNDVIPNDPGSPELRARPLPLDLNALGKHKGAYGKCLYKYTGKHSEGNRFILNSDL